VPPFWQGLLVQKAFFLNENQKTLFSIGFKFSIHHHMALTRLTFSATIASLAFTLKAK